MLASSICDWPRFLNQSFEALVPGGWIELQDIVFPVRCDDGTLKQDSPLRQWSDMMIKATAADGRSAEAPMLYSDQLKEAGFVNVKETVYMWPTNAWPADPYYKELGMWCCENIAGGLSGVSMAPFTRNLDWNAKEVELFLAKVRKDIRDPQIHAWWPM